MASDAHVHPYDLSLVNSQAEEERNQFDIKCAASAYCAADWNYNEGISKHSSGMFLCFGTHPQLATEKGEQQVKESLELLQTLAAQNKLNAVGEIGFDLFNEKFKQTEEIQTSIFEHNLSAALQFDLPVVLHIRRAMQKVFLYTGQLKKLRAVVFHSYSGTSEDAVSLVRRGINAYFSFGTPVLLNHKRAIKACAEIDSSRLLFETDAPYQSLWGKGYSTYGDIFSVLECAARLRGCDPVELEKSSDNNFEQIFMTRT
ncbi:TatD family hydrolase [Spirochaetia bacterium]|nr:TatD family hydrolase [Spirochaetia bacterium]